MVFLPVLAYSNHKAQVNFTPKFDITPDTVYESEECRVKNAELKEA
jgi:hypothetical protein